MSTNRKSIMEEVRLEQTKINLELERERNKNRQKIHRFWTRTLVAVVGTTGICLLAYYFNNPKILWADLLIIIAMVNVE